MTPSTRRWTTNPHTADQLHKQTDTSTLTCTPTPASPQAPRPRWSTRVLAVHPLLPCPCWCAWRRTLAHHPRALHAAERPRTGCGGTRRPRRDQCQGCPALRCGGAQACTGLGRQRTAPVHARLWAGEGHGGNSHECCCRDSYCRLFNRTSTNEKVS
jgi:hypothetical protein